MNERKDAGRARPEDDGAFLDALRRNYTPEPLSPSRRVALRMGVEERVVRQRGWWRPALGVVAVNALALIWVVAPHEP